MKLSGSLGSLDEYGAGIGGVLCCNSEGCSLPPEPPILDNYY